jgi:hypothetical protein
MEKDFPFFKVECTQLIIDEFGEMQCVNGMRQTLAILNCISRIYHHIV